MGRRTVRISLFREGALFGDALLRGSSLTVGKDWKSDLNDPHSDSERTVLVSRGIKGVRLHLPKGAKATFRRKGSTLNLEDMAAWGLLRQTRRGSIVRLRPDVSAEFTIKETSYRLKFVPATKAAATSEAAVTGNLPWRFRFGFPDSNDLVFGAALILIFFLHTMGIRSLRDFPIPEMTIRQLPRRIARIILEPVKPPPPSRVAKTSPTEAEAPQQPSPDLAPGKEEAPAPDKPEVEQVPSPAPGTGREAVRRQVSKVGVLGILTGRGTAGRTSHKKGFTALQLDSDLERTLDEVLSEVKGIVLSGAVSGDGSGAGSGDGDGTALVTIDGIIGQRGIEDQMKVTGIGVSAEPVPRKGPGAEGVELKPEERVERSTRAISRIVSAHTGAIRYAYNRELRKNPGLRGKVVLAFTISPEGIVTRCWVEKTDMEWPPLEDSLVRLARGWKFPAIPEGSVTVTYPLVFFPRM